MDAIMEEAAVAGFRNNPIFVLHGPALLAHMQSLCTWGALLLAAVAALGSLVRPLRKAVRRLRLHRVRVTEGTGCGGGDVAKASVVPEPYPVDFSDDDDESDRRCSASCYGSCERGKEYKHEQENHDDEEHRLGCCADDVDRESDVHNQQQGWGLGVGGWDSWFSCGGVVKAWEQDRGHTDAGQGFFRDTSIGGGPFSGLFPLIEPATLSLSYSDSLDVLQLWDSRLRSCIPAAVIAAPAATLKRRAAVRVGAAVDHSDKVVYVAERRGGGVVFDLRNTKGVLRRDDGAKDTW